MEGGLTSAFELSASALLMNIRVPGYLPPSRPYEMRHLVVDVIRLARYLLVPRGRLVFFLPTFPEETNMDVPMVEGMKELKWGQGSMQNFGRWGRRVCALLMRLGPFDRS